MNLQDAKDMAHDLMEDHFLLGTWEFKFDRAVARYGQTDFRRQVISLSAPLTELNDAEHVKNTILHEIAHVLAGPEAGHGRTWQSMARSIGCTGERTGSGVTVPQKLKATCECGATYKRQRQPSGARYCTPCYRNGKRSRLVWLDTATVMH